MEILSSDIRCAISIRGTRSSTTNEMIRDYCSKYGRINYFHCAMNPQGIMCGYNLVFHEEQAVNRFMDARPHQIDGQSVKVKRCIPANEECRLTTDILITTSDNSMDKHIFQEETLRDYFSRYGLIRACHIEMHHQPCAYLTFKDYDRVDQLINDKPHVINKVTLHIRKYIADNQRINRSTNKRTRHSSNDSRCKRQQRSSSNNIHDEEKQIHESIVKKTTTDNDIYDLQNQYEQFNNQLMNLTQEELIDDHHHHRMEHLNQLENNVENLLEQIRHVQSKKFIDRLFEKYTLSYILSLNENHLNEKLEQLDKESHLLRLIKQNMSSIK